MILDQYQEWKQALEADLVKIEKTVRRCCAGSNLHDRLVAAQANTAMSSALGVGGNGGRCFLDDPDPRASSMLVCVCVQLGDMEQNYLGAEYSQCGTVLKVSLLSTVRKLVAERTAAGVTCVCSAQPAAALPERRKCKSRWMRAAAARLRPCQGFDGFLSSKDVLRKKTRSFKPEDRLFSLSSKTSAVVSEAGPRAGSWDGLCLG